jgi:hypothetical protein
MEDVTQDRDMREAAGCYTSAMVADITSQKMVFVRTRIGSANCDEFHQSVAWNFRCRVKENVVTN